MRTVKEVLRRSADYLAEQEVESPRLDAELLLGKALGLSRPELYLDSARPLRPDELDACRALVVRRGRREPAAYVLGEWGFRRLTLSTDRRALVPRPETEVVVERALELIAGLREPRVLDAGTGSGAIALAIADERPDARVLGLDSSADALELARENARRTGLAGRVRFVRGDFRMGLPGGPYELVVSNPPYVSPDELDDLAPEIRLWEPREALVGGIELVPALAAAAARVLAAGGCLVVEASELRAGEAADELRRAGYRDVAVTADLAGRPRVVEGRLLRVNPLRRPETAGM